MRDDTPRVADHPVDDSRNEPLHAADRVAVRVMAVIALGVALVSAAVGAMRFVLWMSGDDMPVTLGTGAPLDLDPAASEAGIASAEYSTIEVTVTSLGTATRALFASSELLTGLTTAVVAVAIAMVLRRLAQRVPFHRSLFRATLISGLAILFGGMIGGALHGFATMQAAVLVAPELATPVVIGFDIDLAFLIGFVVVAVAFVFRAGTRLQRETEGLV